MNEATTDAAQNRQRRKGEDGQWHSLSKHLDRSAICVAAVNKGRKRHDVGLQQSAND